MPGTVPYPIPNKQTAIVFDNNKKLVVRHDVDVITLDNEPDAVIIKVAAVALNPVDAKMSGDFVTPGAIMGFDLAGTVVAVGPEVKQDLKIGDRVCGSADGMNPLRPLGGAFCQYASAKGDLVLKIPDFMSMEEAAPSGTALGSAGLSLFVSLQVPASLTNPTKESIYVLINGGATSTGTMSIQFAKYAGLKPIVTCSPKNFALVKSLGAVAAFDYHSPTCAEDIRAYTKNALDYAIDCITTEATMKLCYAAIGRAGGRYCALDPFPQRAHTRKVIHPDWILATRVRGEDCIWPEPFGAKGNPKTRAFADELWVGVTPLLQSGKLKFHPLRHMEGGFEGILEGLNILRRGEVSGQKLVYTLDGGDRA